MVAAALRSVFTEQSRSAVEEQWDQVGTMLAGKFPKGGRAHGHCREDVLVFRHMPPRHWHKLWSTNLLERFNQEIKRCTRVVGIFPNDAAIVRLVGAVMLEQDEHWQLEVQCKFSQDSMAAIPPGGEKLPAGEEQATTKA